MEHIGPAEMVMQAEQLEEAKAVVEEVEMKHSVCALLRRSYAEDPMDVEGRR
ncbi:hypothetical protein LTR85_006851 [Meristemomyces frigidus]|nr:hypothetical protein LTR85_006851 [Meristemomyces frigidus]